MNAPCAISLLNAHRCENAMRFDPHLVLTEGSMFLGEIGAAALD